MRETHTLLPVMVLRCFGSAASKKWMTLASAQFMERLVIFSLKTSRRYYRLARDQNREGMCVEEMELIPAQILGGIPAAAAAEGLTSCFLGSCGVQPRPGSRGGSSVSAQGHQLQTKPNSAGRMAGKQKRIAEKEFPVPRTSVRTPCGLESNNYGLRLCGPKERS